ncbi:aromatic acid exporter family protein [Savagea sp. SN6]|uniref:Aromatic acid exporter family protein n=1 Tax=Savagea serpentis TaxID=2785297 RepID=A0A8J7KM67_9BACL|nr:aromatic acid exporter family protein [Savagea serpentis]MBF4502204.1 aromatic acid exporter family protein [Savagea serpentis]
MKLGARIFKTGIAIALALFLSELLQLPNPVFAGIAAIFAVQPSIYRSYLTIVEQIQGNLIGASIAVVFVMLFGQQVLIIGLAAIIIIMIMLQLKLEKSISLALVTMIAIMEIQGDAFLNFALLRLLTIIIGVLSAFVVNLVFIPPKYEKKLFQTIHLTQDEIIRWTRLAARQASEHQATQHALEKIKESLKQIDELYVLFKEERKYFKRNTFGKSRKLVVYRQMIATSSSSYDLLKRLHQYENELIEMPEHFRMMIQERLDTLLTYHEQLHLKFVGKLKADTIHIPEKEDYLQRHEVMDIFMQEITLTTELEEFSPYHLLHVLSAMLYYDEHLEHLDLLITSYQRHHEESYIEEFEDDIY